MELPQNCTDVRRERILGLGGLVALTQRLKKTEFFEAEWAKPEIEELPLWVDAENSYDGHDKDTPGVREPSTMR